MRRHSAWFEYVDEADGSGFVTIKLTSWLKPYLLQVRREFFQFQLGFALDLKSEYSIRLYQYLKRWEFAKRRTITTASRSVFARCIPPVGYRPAAARAA